MSLFVQRAKLAQQAASMRRQFDFAQHAMLHRVDPSMLGRPRLMTRFEGPVVTARSNMSIDVDTDTVFDVGALEIRVPGKVDMTGYLLLVAEQEYIVVSSVTYGRDYTTFDYFTTLNLEYALQHSYAQDSTFYIAGFPLTPVSFYGTGTLQLQFDSPVLVLPGDEIAVFNEIVNSVSTVPVLGGWSKIASVQDAQGVPGDERYGIQLSTPLQQDLTPDNRLFLRAVPGYLSPVLPIAEDIQRRGSMLVDVMSGKVFGKGMDAVLLSVTLLDANKEVVSQELVSKNAFLDAGAFICSDIVLWRHQTGVTSIDSMQALAATAILDNDGCYRVGIVTPYAVRFAIALSSSSDFTVDVATATETTTTKSISGRANISCSYADQGFVTITITGGSSQSVLMKTAKLSEAQYIQYGYRVGIVPGEDWEGSGLLLKPTMLSLLDLSATTQTNSEASAPTINSNTADLTLNTGVML